MQGVFGYAVCPSPSHVSRKPESNSEAIACAPVYGVAGSFVVPITMIGSAPSASRSGSGWRGASQRAQFSRLLAIGAPNSGYRPRSSSMNARISSSLNVSSVSAQLTLRLASSRFG